MSLTDWLKDREQKAQKAADKRAVPGGIWSKCAVCGHIIFQKDILGNYHVCPECGHHFALSPYERVSMLLDDGSFEEIDEDVRSQDPLNFDGRKPYRQSLNNAIETTGRHEAVLTGFGFMGGHRIAFGVFNFAFIGGSMGSVVGEKIARLFEAATTERVPVITVASSGGARMQEGVFSLMQMVKTSAAAERHNEAGLLYISILANPTTGGVLASFTSLADIIIAEPQAVIRFAGQRVIKQTLNETLPKSFQTSESVLQHGMIDMILPRSELKTKTVQLISYMTDREKYVG